MDETSDIVLPMIILIIFIIFIGWMLYLLVSSGFAQVGANSAAAGSITGSATFVCPAGSCPTDILTGTKLCPSEDVASLYINGSQVCNSRYLCDNPQTPFALQTDGSTNLYGVCEPGTECACLNTSRCPQYVRSAFTASNGNAYVSLAGQRITFPQINSYSTSSGVDINVPIEFGDPSTTFCSVPLSWLPSSSPGCNFISNPEDISYDDVVKCMGMVSGCNNFIASPCLEGVLAFITDNSDNLNQQNMINTQVSCVAGTPCPCGTVAIFDTNFGAVVCRALPLT